MSKLSSALLSVRLLSCAEEHGSKGLIVVVDSDGKAEALARLLGQLDPERRSFGFPAWDCLPYDRAAPSPDIMGHRMRVLHALAGSPEGAVVVTTPEAILRRVPPPGAVHHRLVVEVGQPLDPQAAEAGLSRLGYAHADRVEEPGQAAVRGEVVDVFPATPKPYRVTILDGKVAAIHRYDPVSQRSTGEVARIAIDPASEVIDVAEEAGGEATQLDRFPGLEHWLPNFYSETATLFGFAPEASMVVEPQAEARIGAVLGQIAEAYRDRSAADAADPDNPPKSLPPERLFVEAAEWRRQSEARTVAFPGDEPASGVPRFCTGDKPGKAFEAFVAAALEKPHRVVLASAREQDVAALAKQARRATGHAPGRIGRWAEVAAAEPGSVLLMKLAADRGFVDEETGVTLVTGADLLGHHARASSYHAVPLPWHMGDGEFALGDLVIHTEHGVGILRGLDTLETGAASGRETLRLEYAKQANLLAPVDELDRVWRYGAEADAIAPDRLDTDAWQKRRAAISAEIAETARGLVEMARRRDAAQAPKIVPPRRDYERFVAGFPFAPTPDQIHAIDDVLNDLASGRPMDRLVVGDVGFGKTEVALRAAAAAVLAGQQVALVAPTTVLVRQHVHTFEKRFADLGIEVAHLSRLVSSGDARRVKEGLADGSIRMVIGTHALTGKGVAFDNLGLLIVDEEQRFGTAHKAALRELGAGIHVLTLTATPIPRTLQSALVGLQDLSVIATPPARRRPIRTLAAPFDTATIRIALLREKARGGQSFVVVPRIEDLERLADRFATLLPELDLVVGHGRMDTQEVEAAMVAFANGHGDVLLATSIIESGLDVPRANTMVVCGADRFGLAQLHQLRGRVGRGRQQGICYLMTEADHPMAEATERRLATLATFDRLGSGLAISAQDLDARGAGDLMGDDQAGHVRLIGLGLYQHLLGRAIREARGEALDDWTPEINLDGAGLLPASYIPEPEVRLNLYARLARADDAHAVDALAEEIEDRFGPLPEAAEEWLALARLKSLCRSHGVGRVDAGPKAIAFSLRPDTSADTLIHNAPKQDQARMSLKADRVIYAQETETAAERLRLAAQILG